MSTLTPPLIITSRHGNLLRDWPAVSGKMIASGLATTNPIRCAMHPVARPSRVRSRLRGLAVDMKTCIRCGGVYARRPDESGWLGRRYCSRLCYNTPGPVADRFWAKVDKSGGLSACWPWGGAINTEGYGTFGAKGRAHRLSWELTNGPIPAGLYVCHTCDVRNCTNPGHLFLGTHLDNMRDAFDKGRMATGARNGSYTHPESRSASRGDQNGNRMHPERRARGERNGSAKLTSGAVAEIRLRLRAGERRGPLAATFGVTLGTISKIATGRTWAVS